MRSRLPFFPRREVYTAKLFPVAMNAWPIFEINASYKLASKQGIENNKERIKKSKNIEDLGLD